MPKMRLNCPNCRQPITADIEQLFDVGQDPSAKQRLLSGVFNIAQCPHCGFQGNLATPIVYHDPDKELLLTFVPPEVGLPRNEQERMIGALINQAVNQLPQEKRKGYLLRPQEFLTLQGLVERVLEAEGITREMIQMQQQRLNLVQRLISVKDDDVLAEIAKQEDKLIDSEFFNLLRRLVEASLMGGDRESAQQLANLQQRLLPLTTFGRQIESQTKEIEAAVAELQKAGKTLDRDKLLNLVINAPNDTRLRAYVSLARPAMDYPFFQMLSERIDRARSDGRNRLIDLREKLLDMTREVDKQVEARAQGARELLNELLKADDISEAVLQNLPAVDEFFLNELNAMQEQARKQGDLQKLGNLQKIVDVLQQASAAPPEVALIEELLDAADDAGVRKILETHPEEVTPQLIEALTNILGQVQQSDDKELAGRLQAIHRQVVRFSMQKNLQK